VTCKAGRVHKRRRTAPSLKRWDRERSSPLGGGGGGGWPHINGLRNTPLQPIRRHQNNAAINAASTTGVPKDKRRICAFAAGCWRVGCGYHNALGVDHFAHQAAVLIGCCHQNYGMIDREIEPPRLTRPSAVIVCRLPKESV